jgi:hypothetical protein
MIDGGSGFSCDRNVIITETLPANEDTELQQQGYTFRTISATEIHIIVNRLDVDSLHRATVEFYKIHS